MPDTTRSPLTALLNDAPMTLGIALGAIIASVFSWQGNDISVLLLSISAHAHDPWRYVTSALPHVNVMHLAFNVAWLGYFGFILERALGSGWFFALVVFLAAGSSAAEFALASGDVGLSGVIYGLFALLWVLSRRDPRFHGAVGQIITWLFVGWFFFCILTTIAGTFEVGNFAHGAGAVLGGLVGMILTAPQARTRWSALLAGCFALFIFGAVAARPYINISAARTWELAAEADDALMDDDYERSIELYLRLTELEPDNADHWYNLAYGYMQMNRFAEAIEPLERTVELKPYDEAYRETLAWNRAWVRSQDAYHAFFADDFKRSATIYRQAIAYDPSIPELWHGLGHALAALQEYEEATVAFRRALDLDPLNDEYRQAATWAGGWHMAELAHERFLAEDYEGSVVFYRHALRADESVPQWWHDLGLALMQLERFAEARVALGRALELDPEDAPTRELLDWIDETGDEP